MIKDYTQQDFKIINHSYQAFLYKQYFDPTLQYTTLKSFQPPRQTPNKDDLEINTIHKKDFITYNYKLRQEIINNLTLDQIKEYKRQQSQLIKYTKNLKAMKLIPTQEANETIKQYESVIFIDHMVFLAPEIETRETQLTQAQENAKAKKKSEQSKTYKPKPDSKTDIEQLDKDITKLENDIKALQQQTTNTSSKQTTLQKAKLNRTYLRQITGYSYNPLIKDPNNPLDLGEKHFIKWQKYLIESTQRFVYVVGSRQMGKSYTLAQLAIEESFKKEFKILVCSFASEPTHRIRDYILSFMSEFNRDGTLFTYQKKENYIENTVTGSKIYFRTLADDAERVRGMTLDLIIIDEAAYVSNDIYEKVLRPTTLTTGGRIISISSPAKRNWFYEHVKQSQKGEMTNSLTLLVRYTENPFIPPEDRKNIEYQLSRNNAIYRNEYCCEFLGAGNALFQLNQANEFPSIHPRGFHVLAYDPARINDQAALHLTYTYKGHTTGIHSEYIPDIIKGSWESQAKHIKKLQEKTDAFLVVDCTGMGDGVITILKMHGVRVDCVIRYTAGANENIDKSNSFGSSECLKVGKARMISNTLTFLEEDYYSIYPYTNKLLQEECDDIEFEKKNGLITMCEPNGYDDLTNAMMMNLYFINYKNLLTREKQLPRHQLPTIEDHIDTSSTQRHHHLQKVW